MGDRWLSVEDIVAYLGINQDTVYRWISEKNMPGDKIGRLCKFQKEKVDDWMRSGGVRVMPTTSRSMNHSNYGGL